MNDPDIVNQCSIDQDEASQTSCVSSVSSIDGQISGDVLSPIVPEKLYECKHAKCKSLTFATERDWHRHLFEHIALPTVKVRRLSESEQKRLLSKRQRAGPRSRTKKNPSSKKSKNGLHEPLTVRVKIKPGVGSDARSFEVVKVPKVLYGPGGVYCSNGSLDEVKEEIVDTVSGKETPRVPSSLSIRRVELDAQQNEEAGAEEVEEEVERFETETAEEEEGQSEGGDGEGDREEEEGEEDNEEAEGECLDNDEDVPGINDEDSPQGRDAPGTWEPSEEGDGAVEDPKESRAHSPTPSEVLRPTGLLAPDSLGDDDSCYPQSPPGSDSGRMVELNGSGAGISGSDNDSGHSRSPAAFAGGGAGSEDDAQESSHPTFNWEDIVGESSENTAVHADNESGDNRGSDNADVHNAIGEGGAGDGQTLAESESLMLSEPSEAPSRSPTIGTLTVRDFRNQSFPGAGSDADRPGETEYMSLDRLGESPVCCEVCGERAPSRHSLEEHRAVAGHYKCLLIPECGAVLSSAGELAAHQSSVHGVGAHGQQNAGMAVGPGPGPMPIVGPGPSSGPSPGPSPGPSGGSSTPPVQQLAQQVQRLPIPQQQQQPGMNHQPYPGMVPPLAPVNTYGMVPQSMSPQQQQQLGMVPQSISPQQQQPLGAPPNPQQYRRGPGYRVPQQGAPFGPGSPNQGQPQQPGPYPPAGVPPYPGAIQPRPLNTLVAPQQPVQRAAMPVRMAGQQGMMVPQQGVVPRGMAPSVRGQKRMGAMPQTAGRGMPAQPPNKQRRVDIMPAPEVAAPGKKSDAKAVANILATRGITVTPAGVTRPGLTVQQVTAPTQGRARGQPLQAQPQPPPQPQPVTTLNLSSAISIIPSGANNGRQQTNAGFVVPHGRSVRSQPQTTNVERPPRPPTVDLTGDGPTPPPGSTRLQMGPNIHRGRGRPSLQRTMCQICDKTFTSPELLNQHMAVHRNPGKLPFRCNLCNAQYPTQQGLTQHRQTYHKESAAVGMVPLVPGEEMVIPLVDLKQPGVAARLGALGIHHCIPLSGLGNQSNGFFHLPVVSIDGSRTSAAGNLRSLGASGVLSIGPIKLVPRAAPQ